MSGKRPYILVLIRGIPQLNGHVRAAGRKQRTPAGAAKVDIQNGLCVTLDGPLQLAELPVPDLDGVILRARGKRGEDRVECDTCYRLAVGLEYVAGRGLREPIRWVLGAPGERGRCCIFELGVQGLVSGFEVENLGEDLSARKARLGVVWCLLVLVANQPFSAGAQRLSTSFLAILHTFWIFRRQRHPPQVQVRCARQRLWRIGFLRKGRR